MKRLLLILGFLYAQEGRLYHTWSAQPFEDERGGVDIGGLMLMGLGMVFIAVGFILFPVVIEGAEESRTATGVGNYTGLTSIIEVGPTIALVAFLFGGVVAGYFGIKMMRGAR